MLPFQEPVGKKPSETIDKPHFQRHSLPGPDFWAENALFDIFSQNFPLESHFSHYPLQINIFIITIQTVLTIRMFPQKSNHKIVLCH
jgi:hypothetical protein